MNTHSKTLKTESALYPSIISKWLQTKMTSLITLHSDWACRRRIKKSRRVLESLPKHILSDIGWPSVADCHHASSQISQISQKT